MISQSGGREAAAFVQGEMAEAWSRWWGGRWGDGGGVRRDDIADG